MKKMISEKEWNKQYREKAELKRYFSPAFNKAVVPSIGKEVLRLGKSEVDLLVLGSGEGSFSRTVLPAVKKWLDEKKTQVKFNVIETDISEILRKAPGKKVYADVENLPFQSKKFDLAFSDSTIHIPGPEKIVGVVEGISHTLKPNGAIIHVSDFIPEPMAWMGIKFSDLIKLEPKQQADLNQKLHEKVTEMLELASDASGLTIETNKVNGVELIAQKPTNNRLTSAGLREKNAYWHFHLGALASGTGKDLKGLTHVEYTGFVHVLRKPTK